MKTTTFKKRTQRFNKNSKGYILALQLLTGNFDSWMNGKLRTCWTSGRGRFCQNLDYTNDTLEVLRYAGLKKGIDFMLENDSPRGGKTGNYIQLTSKGKRKMIKD